MNTTDAAAYVGSQRCGTCHANQQTQWSVTSHGRTMRDSKHTSTLPESIVDHRMSRRRYRSHYDLKQLHHTESVVQSDGSEQRLHDWPMPLRVGSGNSGYSYLARQNGFLVQSPLTWYTLRQAWDMSPGYDTAHQMGFQRIVSHECISCHAGQVETINHNPFRMNIREQAIGCERCHGPGSLHVAHHTAGTPLEIEPDGRDLTIVNPARLERHLQEAICHQCHLQGTVHTAARGRDKTDFRPGLPLEDFHLEYGLHNQISEMTIVGHANQLQSSPCYLQSSRLTCVTCHHPHAQPPANRVDQVRSICLDCHQQAGCRLELATRLKRSNNDCALCHMPKSPTEVPHVAFTHHRIGLHPRTPTADAPRQSSGTLIALQDQARLSDIDRDRGLGLALFELFRSPSAAGKSRIAIQRARELLQGVERKGAADPPVYAALAGLAMAESKTDAADEYAQHVLRLEPHPSNARIDALRIVANIRFREQRFTEALIPLRELSSARRNARDWFYLGLCQQNCHNTPQALTALKRSLDIDPAQQGAHAAIAAIYESQGRLAEAKRHKRLAARFGDNQATSSQQKEP